MSKEGPIVQVSRCRTCGGDDIVLGLDLGVQPLANAFLPRPDATERMAPLTLVRCRTCGLAFLTVVVDPTEMFASYVYATGYSSTMRDHFAAYARSVQERFVPDGGLVVEVGSNDGTLLSSLDCSRARVLGVDPARNIAELARQKGVVTEVDFFDERVARRIVTQHGFAHAIVANNVTAHIHDIDGVMAGVDALLHEDGVVVVESPSLRMLLAGLLFDTIYHEHLSYQSVGALAALAERHGLRIFDVQEQPVHGGSIRVFMDRARRTPSDAVASERTREQQEGLFSEERWRRFRDDVERTTRLLRELLVEQRAGGRVVWGYGAAAKGNTLLNAAGITAELMPALVDKSTLKQGLFSPGAHIPVVAPARIELDRPNVICVLAWNLVNEIRRDALVPFEARGGRVLVPLPTPRWLS
jgi:novobiocin biosynthesis protein NovU/D-mycarose 3-C-methyltransferase